MEEQEKNIETKQRKGAAPEAANREEERNQVIVRTSVVGIAANVLLAVFKAIVGAASGSIAIVLDAVNNLSDAASSLITIVGTKLAGKQPDRKHPFGYGRIEYLTAVIISVIVLYAGITSLESSVKGILQPETPSYTAVSLVIVAAAVAVKILLGTYVKKTGERVNSGSLVASGEDARMDAVISASTLAAAAVFALAMFGAYIWAVTDCSMDYERYNLAEDVSAEIDGDGIVWLCLRGNAAALSAFIYPTVSDSDGHHMGYNEDFDKTKKAGYGVTLRQIRITKLEPYHLPSAEHRIQVLDTNKSELQYVFYYDDKTGTEHVLWSK